MNGKFTVRKAEEKDIVLLQNMIKGLAATILCLAPLQQRAGFIWKTYFYVRSIVMVVLGKSSSLK